MAQTVRARDYCVVETAPLSELLNAWVNRWRRERPTTTGGKFGAAGARTEAVFYSATQFLIDETARLGAPLPFGTINTVLRGESRHTELRIADPILAAISQPGALSDGTLEVKPNPRLSAATRAEAEGLCCPGATARITITGAGARTVAARPPTP